MDCSKCIRECGYHCVGLDISPAMLSLDHAEGIAIGLICADIGQPLPIQAEAFNYAISISVVQWLFQSYQTEDQPAKRIRNFFRSLYQVISVRAVIQFYCSKKETDILMKEAINSGFYGGLVVDNEGTKNCKILDKYKPAKNAITKNAKPIKTNKKLSNKNKAIVE